MDSGEFMKARDQCGHTIDVFRYGEDYIPVAQGFMDDDPRIHMPRLREMDARDDDINICANMKAGTHWVWELTKMLTSGQAEYAPGPKEDTMLEFRSVDKLDSLPSPRIFNTHLRLSNLPRQMVEKKCKIIFVVRNPKDIAVSMYSHMSAKGSSFAYKGNFDDFLSLFKSDIVPHNAWGKYMAGWEKDLEEHKDIPRHVMYFEDMKQNPIREVRRLASYLQVTASESLIQRIADKCSFGHLKEGKTQKEDKWSFMYRKGEVGDWKHWFTVTQNEEFDKYILETMADTKFTFKYSL